MHFCFSYHALLSFDFMSPYFSWSTFLFFIGQSYQNILSSFNTPLLLCLYLDHLDTWSTPSLIPWITHSPLIFHAYCRHHLWGTCGLGEGVFLCILLASEIPRSAHTRLLYSTRRTRARNMCRLLLARNLHIYLMRQRPFLPLFYQ